ncbi:hypothetical protein GGX14DRAFT_326630, partial [Mycena pura]
ERAIDAAAQEIRHGQTVSEAAARHGVKPATAWHRANGRVSRYAAREAQQALTHAEEDQLVADLDMLDRLGIRLTHAMVKARAEGIRRSRGVSRPLSAQWVGQHFVRRHPEIRTALSRPKDRVRLN